MTDAEREQADRGRQAYRKVRRAPGVMATRLTELGRQLAEDDLTPSQRAMKEQAVESLERAFRAQKKCRKCGRPLSDPLSIQRATGPECWEKAS
jgi:hypothetical protein